MNASVLLDPLEAAVRAHTLAWIKRKNIVNEKGKPILVGKESPHFFLRALYDDESDEIAVQKPSQAGVSTWVILVSIHDGRYHGINQIHTLPTANDVGKFVPSKTNEIIKRNPSIRGGMKDKEVDAIAQKQFGKGFLYYKGTFSEREGLMLSSDVNWYDELDKSDQSAIGFFDSRQEGADSLRKKRWVSTPTVPNFGINKVFLSSDQKEWRFSCKHCGLRQHMSWPDNVDFRRRCYACRQCGKEIGNDVIRAGTWEARFPGRKISGYHITQMIVPWVSAGDMIDYYEDAVAGRNGATLEYFFNHKLGEPYLNAESQIPESVITQNLTAAEHLEVNSIMGVDVQERELYIILGNEEGVYGILRIPDVYDNEGELVKSKWDRWAELMEVYDVRYCVIDGGFKPNEVIEAAQRFPGKVWVSWYKDDPKKEKIIRWGDEDFTGKQKEEVADIQILTERDRMIDWLLKDLRQGLIRFFYGPADPATKMLIQHVGTTYARIVTDRVGQEHREWVSTGKDDLLHALVYYRIALERKRRNERQ